MNNLKSKKIRVWGSVLLIVAVFSILIVVNRGSEQSYDFITVEKGEIIQEVNVTGKVKPAQSVDLQFENSGRIASVNFIAGDKVASGMTIASLENEDARAQVLEKEASLESAQADLDQTIRNFNSLTNPDISTALKTDLDNAEVSLINVQKKTVNDLVVVYNSGLNTINEAMIQADSSFLVLKNLREVYFNSNNEDGNKVQSAEDTAKIELYGLLSYNRLGAKDYVAIVNSDKSNENVDIALDKLNIALAQLKNAYSILQSVIQENLNKVSTSDRTTANSEAVSITSELSAVTNAISNISSQKITNESNISDAQSRLSTAKSAFPTSEDIIKKQAGVKQAEALLLSAQSQLKKSIIIAPFSGIISKIDRSKGETINSSDIIASMLSTSKYQIEANITEFDVAKVKVGDAVSFTLDAYGSDIVFSAIVSSINPGETIIEGVTTYKTTIDFPEADDRIRSNMTANLDIETDRKNNIIAIPQRAVTTKDGNKFVRILIDENVKEVEVRTGLTGKNGLIEIISGLNDGDRVVTFINN